MTYRQPRGAAILSLLLACAGAGAQQYAFHDDTQEQGLDSLTVNCMLQDRSGYIWVCTENGLYRFDDSSYTRFGHAQGLDDSFIVAIHEDPLGELWVGTVNNLYHGDGRHFVPAVPATHALSIGLGQQLDSVDRDHLLAVSKKAVTQLTRAGPDGTWTTGPYFSPAMLLSHPELKSIQSVRVTRDGSVWMGCDDSICQVTRGSIRIWGSADGVPKDVWSSFLQDSAGRFWARGSHHVLALDEKQSRFLDRDIPSASVSISNGLLPLVEDSQRHILTRTDLGLAIWDGSKWRTVGAANGLTTPGIRSLLVDRDGVLWFGTFGSGVQRWLGYGNWETWSTAQGLPDAPVWSMLRDKEGKFWVTTESGIYQFDQTRSRFAPWKPSGRAPFARQVVSVRQAQDGTLWFLSGGGKLLRYIWPSGGMKEFAVPENARDMWLDSVDQPWIFGSTGIYQFDRERHSVYHIHDPAVPDLAFSGQCQMGPDTWFASKGGLVHFTHGRWTDIRGPGKNRFDGFASVACAPDGTLWLGGTSTGVLHLRVENDIAAPADPSPPQSLDSVEVMFLRFDHRGWLWIGSGSGVYVFNGTLWRHLTRKNGLAWDDCSEGAFLEDTDSSIWIGTSNGLAHLLRQDEIFRQRPLSLIVASATLGNSQMPVNSFASFAWTREPLRLHVATSDVEDQPSIVYRYRMQGFDRDWAVTRSSDLRFPSLGDGKYRLELYAEDTDRGVRSPTAVISFRLRSPWWKGVPLEIIVILLLGGILYFLARFRDRRMIARQLELEALVKARTTELEKEKKQLEEAREALREQANRDALTGLFNRRAIHEMLIRETSRIRRERSILSVVMIDLDHFKLVNDRYGHVAGDEVLREVAVRLSEAIRPYDAVGRIGGEEFLLVMPEFDAALDLTRLGAIHNTICGKPVTVADGEVRITCSFGVTVLFSDQPVTLEQLLDRADKALYKAKRGGRNRIEFDRPTEVN
jgi:diguanylate cyclase (GGDEF)-like protein